MDEVHLRRTDKACYKQVAREIVQHLRRVKLLDDTVLHDADTVAHGHCLGLVVGDVNKGGVQLAVQLADLGTHGGTQLGVQVGQRLVKQEYRRVTHHRTAQCNTLTLAARQSLGLAIEQVLQIQNACSLVHLLVDLFLGHLAQLQTKCDVLINGHVRIQRIVLEYHRNIAILRRNIIDHAITDAQLAAGNLLQTRDHAQRGRFTTARRADQNDKFLVLNLQIQIRDGLHIARIGLIDMGKCNARHYKFLQKNETIC